MPTLPPHCGHGKKRILRLSYHGMHVCSTRRGGGEGVNLVSVRHGQAQILILGGWVALAGGFKVVGEPTPLDGPAGLDLGLGERLRGFLQH